MGQRRLATVAPDDQSKRPNQQQARYKSSNNTVLSNTTVRKGEAFRAQRRTSENVNQRASQHVINVPVNKSVYNGYDGRQFSPADQKKQPRSGGPSIKIIPIGGLGEMGIGKNMMAVEYDNEIIVIDCGFLFPGADYPGINYITPDVAYLEENKHKIRGIVFTHAHLDHVGAFRHIAAKIPAPVYATKFTIGMLQKNMEESPDEYRPEYTEVNPDTHEQVQIGDSFNIEFIRVPHSMPDCAAVVIRTPIGVLVHSGDWRLEDAPIDGKKFDFERLTEIATKEGILMLMNESTNAETDGAHTHSEFDIQESMGQIMEKYVNNRIIISCFSSHIYRMQLILDEAKKHDRKVAFAGYSIIQNLEVALRTGILKVPKDVVVKMEDLVKMPDSKVTIICTGSQGEFNAVLARMASGSHKFIKIKNSDVIAFSSNPVPGNEKFVTRTVDGLMREGSEVIQNNKTHLTGIGPLHLSGHAYADDHAKLIAAVNPKYYMPIHGEFHMLVHNSRIAERVVGMKRENIFVCDSGDVIEINANQVAKKTGRVPVGGIMYDDSGAVVSEVVLKDRIHMATEGMFVVVLTVQRGSGRLMTSPDIISRGFIYLRDSEELMGMIRQYLKQKVARTFSGKHVDLDVVKKELKDEITHILYDQTRRTPIVIPVINEIGGGAPGGAPQKRQGEVVTPQTKSLVNKSAPRRFPEPQVPDSEVNELRPRFGRHSY
ncbi:ribonuclease J [Candidatus Saccharibacteria bacterium]|nr:ribonuclease J [Candidatus Saccharibacteria bacterium]